MFPNALTRFSRRPTQLAAAAFATLAVAACGGGDATDVAPNAAQPLDAAGDAPTNRAGVASAAPVGTLSLVSVLATGGMSPCAVSADGNIVAFADNSSGRDQVQVRNVSTGALVLGSTAENGSPLGRAVCRGLSPNGRFLVLDLPGFASDPLLGTVGRDAALFVKDLQTGSLRRVTPELNTLPTTRAFAFVGISNNGERIAFLGLPTVTYDASSFSFIATGPTRLLLRDLSSSQVVDLSSTARLEPTTADGVLVPAPPVAALSGDGTRLAFVSRALFPEVGDSDGLDDVLVLDLNSGALTLASQDTPTTRGFAWNNLRGFAAGNTRVVYQGAVQLQQGVASGLYSNVIGSNAVRLLATTPVGNGSFFSGAIGETIAFDDALKQVVFLRYDGQARANQPWLRDLSSGAEQRIDRTAAGVLGNSFSSAPLISADGTQVAFGTFASNLVRLGRFTPRGQVYRKTVAVAVTTAQ